MPEPTGEDSKATELKPMNAKAKTDHTIVEHMLSLEELCELYQVKIDAKKPQQSQGLGDEIVRQRQGEYGLNAMTPPKQVPLIVKYFLCLTNLFNLLLIISGILSFIVYAVNPAGNPTSPVVALVLIGVAMLNALIDFAQERKSAKIMESFLDMVPRKCSAIRNGKLDTFEAASLVPGDVIYCRMGDKVPADFYVIWSSEFKVDNSSLTGESEPQERFPANKHENHLEATNLAFNGSMIVNGEAYGIVLRTGDRTVLGQIAGLAGSEKKRLSPMAQEVDDFVHRITAVAILFAVVFFAIGFTRKNDFGFNMNFAIGVFVSFVPEGLPTTMAILLTIAAGRMAKRNVLVKDLRGVETLGAITCLATDKTGTLTRNQMTVTFVWSALKMWDAFSSSEKKNERNADVEAGKPADMFAGLRMTPQTDNFPKFDAKLPELGEVLSICYLCSKARFDRTNAPIKDRNVIGDATESGLFRFAAETIPESDKLRETYPKVFEIPFNSTNKWHLSIHKKEHASGDYTLFIKGAPERIIRLCTSILLENGKIEALSDVHQHAFMKSYELMASKGHRVIGCAELRLSREQYPEGFIFRKDDELKEGEKLPTGTVGGVYPKTGYVFAGLVSLEDPPKHGVREAIGKCRQAGIKVMMVTGDHPLTAEAIGRKINLMLQETREMIAKRTGRPVASIKDDEYNAVVVHGEQIDKLSEEDWESILSKEEIIFARTSPKHKLQIVKRCQARGHIVGVTGDGVNDSPALKTSDLGISMNISGSDVSKEAAAMILLDDNFASTVAGVAEGRLIFQNLKKSIRYTLTHIMPEVIANLAYLVAQIPLPLNPLQIIVIDMGFELCVALSYAWEVPESKRFGLMTMLPRKPVTNKSIDILRQEKEAKKSKQMEIEKYVHGNNSDAYRVDQSEEDLRPLSFAQKCQYKFAHIRYWFAHLFDTKLWKLYFTPREEDVLISNGIQIWAYLEAGILQTIGCFIVYFCVYYNLFGTNPGGLSFTPSQVQALGVKPLGELTRDEVQVINSASSAYFFSILIQQSFNVFICKVTRRMPFGLMMFRNWYTFIGVFLGAAFSAFIVYVPAVQESAFQTYTVFPGYWLPAFGMGLVLLGYSCLRIMYLKRLQPQNKNMALPLDLHPTRWSTKGE